MQFGETAPTRTKYLDVDRWLRTSISDAERLKLHVSAPLLILDIGTGPGYFPYVCNRLGHNCVGLDKPSMYLFQLLREWVGTETVEHHIRPYKPLPRLEKRFDLVTSFRSAFNAVRAQKRWFTIQEWTFFLDDLRDNVLRPGGSVALKLRPHDDKFEGLSADSPELVDFFISRGATVLPGRTILFEPLH